MPQLDPVANADPSIAVTLKRFEALPLSQQLPLLAFILREELNSGTFGRKAAPAADDRADVPADAVAPPAIEAVPPAIDVDPASQAGAAGEDRNVQGESAVKRRNALSAPEFRPLAANAPWFASLVISALIGMEFARIAVAGLYASPIKPSAARAITPIPPRRPSVDVPRIMEAHLFGRVAADPGDQDPATAAPTTARLALVGTIATEDPKRGVAIISDGGPSRVYGVGQDVGPAKLHSVYMNRVVIDRGGTLETLTLQRAQPFRALGGAAAVALRLDGRAHQEGEAITDVIRTVAETSGRDRKMRGFRVYPGRLRGAFPGTGLKGGDLVTAVNGAPLDDPQRSREIWNAIQSFPSVKLTVERGGRTQELGVNLAQFAGEFRRDR